MKLILAAAATFAVFAPAAAFAQSTPASTPAPAAAQQTAPAAKFNLDTPIETLVADPKAKAVLDTDLGMDVTQHPAYDQFKGASLHQVAPQSGGMLTDELLKKIETDLAAIK